MKPLFWITLGMYLMNLFLGILIWFEFGAFILTLSDLGIAVILGIIYKTWIK